LVRALARRYAWRADLDDLVGAGSLGLVKAATRFRPEQGVEFQSFATPTIAGEMQHFMRDCLGPVRLPRRDQEVSRSVRCAKRELTARLRRPPTDDELARASDVDRDLLARAVWAELAQQAVPLTEEQEQERRDGVADAELRASLAAALKRLPHRERQVVMLRFFADLSQCEIARHTGASQTQVSRLLTAALARLRTELGGDFDSRRTVRSNLGGGVEETAADAYTRGHGDRSGASAVQP
jgi:RNA polymerase sigma-B factor